MKISASRQHAERRGRDLVAARRADALHVANVRLHQASGHRERLAHAAAYYFRDPLSESRERALALVAEIREVEAANPGLGPSLAADAAKARAARLGPEAAVG